MEEFFVVVFYVRNGMLKTFLVIKGHIGIGRVRKDVPCKDRESGK
jgi:hypothetical protein